MKRVIIFLLIVLILGISIYMNILDKRERDLEKSVERGYDYADIKEVEENIGNLDLSLKKINYPIMNFFKGINSKSFNIDVYPEYIDFYSLEDDFFEKRYNLDNVFYEIRSMKRIGKLTLADVRFKEEDNNIVYKKTFSTDGKYVVDEAFIEIDSVTNEIINNKYSIKILGKAVYQDKSVFKVEIENFTNNIIEIDSSMYGFYAKDDLNKYYHKLVNGSYSYKILPLGTRTYFIEFPVANINEFFININGEEIRLL